MFLQRRVIFQVIRSRYFALIFFLQDHVRNGLGLMKGPLTFLLEFEAALSKWSWIRAHGTSVCPDPKHRFVSRYGTYYFCLWKTSKDTSLLPRCVRLHHLRHPTGEIPRRFWDARGDWQNQERVIKSGHRLASTTVRYCTRTVGITISWLSIIPTVVCSEPCEKTLQKWLHDVCRHCHQSTIYYGKKKWKYLLKKFGKSCFGYEIRYRYWYAADQ